MIIVQLESPFKGINWERTEFNEAYAHKCVADSLSRGETPFASHILYTKATNDMNPIERAFGIEAGLNFLNVAKKSVVYTDFGISKGMELGIQRAIEKNVPVEFRNLNKASYKEFWIKNKHLFTIT